MKRIFRITALIMVVLMSSILFLACQVKAADHEPVIIVPGILGSLNVDVIFKNKSGGEWSLFPLDHSYDNLIMAFENEGYVLNEDLFIAFYDWRQSNLNSAVDYLKPTINKALAHSSTGKVNIIAHSMGGLVVRAYIESDNYENDVDQLVLLGTPNQGSSDVYTLWEGGIIPKNWDIKERAGLGVYLLYMKTITTQTADNYDTIHTYIPSVGELFPNYEFLRDLDAEHIRDIGGDTGGYYPPDGPIYKDWTEVYQNNFLDFLDSNEEELKNIGGLTTIAGIDQGTVETIPVVARDESENKLWPDGLPNPLTPNQDSTDGDGRVILSSALIPRNQLYQGPIFQVKETGIKRWLTQLFAQTVHADEDSEEENEIPVATKVMESSHGDLPTKAIPDVFEALGLNAPSTEFVPPVEPDNITVFWFASPVQVKIIDPQGRSVTKDSNDIPGAVYTGESDPNGLKMVLIPNAVEGQYDVELTGTGDGHYHMAVTIVGDSNDDQTVIVEKDIKKDEKIVYKTDINPEAQTAPVVSDPVIEGNEGEEEPPVVVKTPVDLVEELIVSVNDNYASKAIHKKSTYQSLMSHTKIALASLREAEQTRELGKRFPKLHDLKVRALEQVAKLQLRSFIASVEKGENKKQITAIAADDMSKKAQAALDAIDQ